MERENKQSKIKIYCCVFLLLTTMATLCIASMCKDSATYDEVPHIAGGQSYLTQQDYRINPEHPPLIKDIEAILPLTLLNLKFPTNFADWQNKTNPQWEVGYKILYDSGYNPDQILFWSRLPIVFLALLLGFYIFKWASEEFGDIAGLISLTLYSFSPLIIAHSRFVTIDLGITALTFISLYYFYKLLEKPNWKTFLVATIVFTLAQLGKFTGLVLGPVFIAVIFFKILKKEKNNNERIYQKATKYIALLLSLFIVSFLIIGAVYQWHIAKMPTETQHTLIDHSIGDKFNARNVLHKMTENAILRPYAQYTLGVLMVFVHATIGHSTFFKGMTGNHWRNYFFTAFAIKELIAWQILLYISSFFFIFKLIKKLKEKKISLWKYIEKNYIYIGAFSIVCIYLILGMIAKLQLGIRYILPIFPFLYFFTGIQIADLLKFIKKNYKNIYKGSIAVLVFLLAWGAAETIIAFPSYLSYYNQFIGGSKNGYKYLVDSNTDWGQDLIRLTDFVEKNNIQEIKVNYFGGGRPEYYLKDKYRPLWASMGPQKGWIAVSASWIQWLSNNPSNDSYEWLKNYEPTAFIGNSIFVYYIK